MPGKGGSSVAYGACGGGDGDGELNDLSSSLIGSLTIGSRPLRSLATRSLTMGSLMGRRIGSPLAYTSAYRSLSTSIKYSEGASPTGAAYCASVGALYFVRP